MGTMIKHGSTGAGIRLPEARWVGRWHAAGGRRRDTGGPDLPVLLRGSAPRLEEVQGTLQVVPNPVYGAAGV